MFIVANSGKITYGIQSLLVDTEEELKAIDTSKITPGSDVYVTGTSKRYILNTKHKWDIIQGGGGIIPPISHLIYDGGSAQG